jgi:large subunit ribosomal protein L25
MEKHSIKAAKRKLLGRKVKSLRKKGILPANIYGKGVKSLSVEVILSDFQKVYKKAGETGLVEIVVDSKKRPVLIHNIQKDPVTDDYIHADFLQVDLKKKVIAGVPVELSGEAPAEKQGLGTAVQYINEVEVEALPADLPEKFELDLSSLESVDGSIVVGDIKVDKKKVAIQNDPEQILVKVEELRKEEPEPEPEIETTEGAEEEASEEGEKTEGVKKEGEKFEKEPQKEEEKKK